MAPYHRLRIMSDAFVTTIVAWLADASGDVVTLFRQVTPDGRLGVESHIEAQIRW
jgi:hypothetical protein